MTSITAPSFSIADWRFFSSAASAPALTSTPTLLPAKLSGPFSMMLSAGEAGRSSRGAIAASAGFGSFLMPSLSATAAREGFVDVQEMRHHPFADDRVLAFAQLERQRHRDMALLRRGLADEELPRLTVVVSEALGPQPQLWPFFGIGE